jgi:response regulator RpfG family c-di-GMP phosphodiesterase
MLKKINNHIEEYNILITDDEPVFLDTLTQFLEKGKRKIEENLSNKSKKVKINIHNAQSKEETLQKIIEDEQVIDIAIIDQNLPDGDGVNLINTALDRGFFLDYILISGDLDPSELRSRGVVKYHQKPIKLNLFADEIHKLIDDKYNLRHIERETTLTRFYNLINEKTLFSQNHINELLSYIDIMANKLNLSLAQTISSKRAATYHDVGKLCTPEEIFLKPVSELTKEEKEIARKHVERGTKLLRLARCYEEAEIVYQHHEKWDGSGYPQGLKGEEIRLEARLISVVEGYCGDKYPKPYKKAVKPKKAYLDMIENARKNKKDPYITQKFNEVLLDIGKIKKETYEKV